MGVRGHIAEVTTLRYASCLPPNPPKPKDAAPALALKPATAPLPRRGGTVWTGCVCSCAALNTARCALATRHCRHGWPGPNLRVTHLRIPAGSTTVVVVTARPCMKCRQPSSRIRPFVSNRIARSTSWTPCQSCWLPCMGCIGGLPGSGAPLTQKLAYAWHTLIVRDACSRRPMVRLTDSLYLSATVMRVAVLLAVTRRTPPAIHCICGTHAWSMSKVCTPTVQLNTSTKHGNIDKMY